MDVVDDLEVGDIGVSVIDSLVAQLTLEPGVRGQIL